jgi:post-segregation antitoxin (ccd killing protein)
MTILKIDVPDALVERMDELDIDWSNVVETAIRERLAQFSGETSQVLDEVQARSHAEDLRQQVIKRIDKMRKKAD